MTRPSKSPQHLKRARQGSTSEHEDDHASLPSEKRKRVRWGSGLDTVEDGPGDDSTEEDTSSVPEKVRFPRATRGALCSDTPLQICLAATSQL